MQRAGAGGGVVYPQVIMQPGGGDKIIQIGGGAAKRRGRVEGVIAAAIDGNLVAIQLRPRLGGDVKDSGGAVAKLGREGAGDQRHRIDEMRINFLPEPIESFRQQNAVEAVLRIAMVAADMHFSELVLHHPRRVQQDLLKRGVFTLPHGLDLTRPDPVGDRAQAGSDGLALRIQMGGDRHRGQLRGKVGGHSHGVGCGKPVHAGREGGGGGRNRRPDERQGRQRPHEIIYHKLYFVPIVTKNRRLSN